jgi:8-oxo-dGTP pyrophosphatase MutT (NUDIX family)
MAREPSHKPPERAKLPTLDQVSAGGVAFRYGNTGLEVALILVGPQRRWQLPKGIVDQGETPEITAVREVREEAGIDTELLRSLETIEYWYVGSRGKQRVRFHKFVHFFLLAYKAGDVCGHDREVHGARWVAIAEAQELLAFKSERKVVAKAAAMIAALDQGR